MIKSQHNVLNLYTTFWRQNNAISKEVHIAPPSRHLECSSPFNYWNSSKLSKIQDKRKNNSTLLRSNDVLTIVIINLRYTSLAVLS